MWVVLLFLVAVAAGLIFRKLISDKHYKGGLWKAPSKRERRPWEGRTMTDPGRHRAKDPAEAPLSDLAQIESIDPWRFTHHLYRTMEFTNIGEAFRWVVSPARKGRTESWVVRVPRAVQWTGALRETATISEFKDYFLDSFPKRPAVKDAELTDAST